MLVDLKQKYFFSVVVGLLTVANLAMPPDTRADGKSIYVAPVGNDNNSGTISQPLRTIQAGVNMARAGDTVYVRGGTYFEEVSITRSGTRDDPIMVRAYPGETPVIDGRAGVECLNCGLPDAPIVNDRLDPNTGQGFNWNALVGIQGDHIIFKGFVVKRSMGRGIMVWNDNSIVSNVNLRKNQVLDSRNAGILLAGQGADDVLIENNIISHSGSFAQWTLGRNSENGWPVTLYVTNSNHVTVRGNTVFENWGEGIGTLNSGNITLEDNIVYDNMSAQIYVHRVENLTVQRNLIYHTNRPEFLHGDGNPSHSIVVNNESQFQGGLVNNKIDIIDNIAVGGRHNFVVFNNQGENYSSNNFLVAYNVFLNAVNNRPDRPSQNVRFVNDNYNNFRFENNIVYQGTITDGHEIGSVKSGVSYAHNLWYPNHPEDGGGKGPGDVIGQDPQFVDPRAYELPENWSQIPSSNWFKIKSGSPAIDQGRFSLPLRSSTDIFFDLFFGMRNLKPDIGVHEYGSHPYKAKKNFSPIKGNKSVS